MEQGRQDENAACAMQETDGMPSVVIKKALPLLRGRQGGKWPGARVYWSAARAFSMRCMASLMASRAVFMATWKRLFYKNGEVAKTED